MSTNVEDPPPALFKYCTAATGLRIITESRIRFTPAEEFNDPFEVLPVISPSAEELDKMTKEKLTMEHAFAVMEPGKPLIHVDFNKFSKANYSTLRAHVAKTAAAPHLAEGMRTARGEHFGILCLTESMENLIMWAHYADQHRGCVVEFDSRHAFFREPAIRSLGQVKYSEQWARYVYQSRDPEYLLYQKSIHWEEEREWRMYGDFSTMESTTTDKGKRIYLTRLPPGVITAIYLGVRMTESDSARFERIAASTQVRIFKATIDLEKFALNFHPHPTGRLTQTTSHTEAA